MPSALLPVSAAHATYLVFNTPPEAVRNTYGELGAFDTPSARMAPDGEISFTFGDLGDQQRYNLAFQALPWLETSFRYSHIVGRYPGYDDRHYYDRSFGLKVRLVKEDDMFPDVSVGIRDLLGTGALSSEYVVASKNVGPFNISAGLGWGAMAQRAVFSNPLGLLFKSFKTRSAYSSGGGQVDFGMFFRGPDTGAFGSIAWQTPVDGLQLLAEYSSDKYQQYNYDGGVKVRSPLNIGLSYRPLDSIALSAGWFYGSTVGITMSVRGDPTKTYPSAMRLGPQVPDAVVRTDVQQQDALRLMLDRNKAVSSVRAGKPWTSVLTPEESARQTLLQVFRSGTAGVRSVEPKGKSLIIDARLSSDPSGQCASYARVAHAGNTNFTTLVLTDLQDPGGRVQFCSPTTKTANLTGAGVTMIANPVTEALRNKIKSDIAGQDVAVVGLTTGRSEVWVFYETYRYAKAAEAAGRIARILMADLPPNIEVFHLIPGYLGMELNEITVFRSALERELSSASGLIMVGNTVQVARPPLDNPARDPMAGDRYPMFSASFDPKVTQRLYDPDAPIQFNIYGDAAGLLQIAPGLTLAADVTGMIWSNYSFTRDAGSVLQHVRSDVLKYQKRGKYGISGLQLIYQKRVARDVFAEVRGGYFEDMFMGVGGQVLWRPADTRLAFGADIYQVWQRAYNRLFGLQRFNGEHYDVLTGHVSAYYNSPWYGLNFAVHAGRYLAGDRGATFEITRRFSSGVEIGAWATFTNVPFSKFGEGSFDKGIIVHIPFEWGLPIWSQSSYDIHMNSLTRDGGQRLAGDDSLYGVTDAASYGEIVDHLDAFREP
jgi:hypothetical protein